MLLHWFINRMINVLEGRSCASDRYLSFHACLYCIVSYLELTEQGRERSPAATSALPTLNKKLSYHRETARQLRTSFSARSLIVHFTEHCICCTTIYNRLDLYRHYQLTNRATYMADEAFKRYMLSRSYVFVGHMFLYH